MALRRPRLRIAKPCQWCKQHRKKCDGKRPHCGPCLRRGYLCSWANTDVSKLLELSLLPNIPDPDQDQDQDHISNVDSTHYHPDPRFPTLDVPQSSSGVETELPPAAESNFDIATLKHEYSSGQKSLASTTDFGNHFDEHIIICGVLYGWDFVNSLFLLDSQWPHIVFFDSELVKLGFRPVRRMAGLWFCRMKMKVIAAASFGLVSNVPLPRWAVADVHDQMHGEPLINYIPWPSIRRAAMSSPARFTDPKFSNRYARSAVFVWPSDIRTAYTTSTSDSMCRFSPEFMLRVTNLRSWTFTKVFLDENPDLRAFAPQYEPSVTNLRVSSCPDLERLYWQMLRRRYESFLKEKR